MRPDRLSAREFREALQGTELRALQVVHLGLAGGVLAAVAVAVLVLGVRAPSAPSSGVARTVAWVSMTAFGVALPTSQLLFTTLLRRGLGRLPVAAPAGAAEALAKLRVAYIVRSAILEAPALLGAVAYVLAARGGRIEEEPRYWFTLLPAAAFLAMSALTVPTRGRLERLFEERTGC